MSEEPVKTKAEIERDFWNEYWRFYGPDKKLESDEEIIRNNFFA